MKKKVFFIWGLIFSLMISSLPIALQLAKAQTEEIAPGTEVESQKGMNVLNNSPTDISYYQAKIKKNGWEGTWNFENGISMMYYVNTNLYAKTDIVATKAGYKDFSYSGTISAKRKFKIKGYRDTFEVCYMFVPDPKTGKEEYAFVEVTAQIGKEKDWKIFYYSVKDSKNKIIKDMSKYFKKASSKN